MIVPDGARLSRPGIEDDQVAVGGALEALAFVVHQRRLHTEERQGRGARLLVDGTGQRSDHDAAGLGLPPGIDDRAFAVADHPVEPLPGLGVDRLAHRAKQAQAIPRAGIHHVVAVGHQGTHRGGGGVENIDLVLVDDLTHPAVGRIARHPLEHQGHRTVGQGPIDDVAVAGDPAHVRGAPVDLVLVIVEHVLVGEAGVGQVATGGVLEPLGGAGGAGGIQDEQRILGAHLFGGAVGVLVGHCVVVPDVTSLVPFDVTAGTLDHQHLLGHVGAITGQCSVDVVLQRYLLATAYGLVGGDDDP